jgi:cellobiose-specific phosphotransferase system component IIA
MKTLKTQKKHHTSFLEFQGIVRAGRCRSEIYLALSCAKQGLGTLWEENNHQ